MMKVKIIILISIILIPFVQFMVTGKSFLLPKEKIVTEKKELIYCVENMYDGSKLCFKLKKGS